MFAGRQLADDCCLASSGVADEATLNVLARLLGGAKKRKKKTYTKPKKIKHKHKKIKLRVLKFYKVCSGDHNSRIAPAQLYSGRYDGHLDVLLTC